MSLVIFLHTSSNVDNFFFKLMLIICLYLFVINVDNVFFSISELIANLKFLNS